ncbi:TetR/AcrR family transcriptional regulator [Nocardia asteroides]|uniref:TetR/AcrR family transcriptional regulator n=1 Tax=Nocardia asteroides TaxID=1824 RepID=UPI0033D667A3
MSEAPPAGRPRDVRIDEAVLAAARDLVAEVGYADLTFRAIAERAGTSVPAIRRRWASKAHLVHEAVYPADAVAAPTGAADLRAEVRAVVERCLEIVGSPAGRRATPALMSELMADHALEEELSSRLLSAGWDTLAARLAEAAARGEARPDVDLGLFIEMVFGTTLVAIVLRGRAAVDDAWVDEVVRSIVDGLAAR